MFVCDRQRRFEKKNLIFFFICLAVKDNMFRCGSNPGAVTCGQSDSLFRLIFSHFSVRELRGGSFVLNLLIRSRSPHLSSFSTFPQL